MYAIFKIPLDSRYGWGDSNSNWGPYSKEGAFTVSLTFLRCWLSLIFRVGPVSMEAEKKKMGFQNVFFFLQDRCSKDQ